MQDSAEVPADWHPRRCDSRKTYEYRILNRRFPLPTRRLDTYFTYCSLDVSRMREAAGYLVGTHDFKSFSSSHTAVEDTVRTVYRCSVEKEGDIITIRVTGSGFLYNMVRIIAGTLLQVGIGEIAPEQIAGYLRGEKPRRSRPHCAGSWADDDRD